MAENVNINPPTTRSYDFVDLIINMQKSAQAGPPEKSTIFMAGIGSGVITPTGSIDDRAGAPPYYCGATTDTVTTNTIICGYWSCGS